MVDEWILLNGKLVCSNCGDPIEEGMPYKGEKFKREGDRWVRDEFYDMAMGYDECKCKKSSHSYAFNAEESLKQGKRVYDGQLPAPSMTDEERSILEDERRRKNDEEWKQHFTNLEISEKKEVRKIVFFCVTFLILYLLILGD